MSADARSERDGAGPLGRPPVLVLRTAAGCTVLAASTTVALEGLPQWEDRVFRFLNEGPDGAEWGLWLPMQLGSLFGPFAVGALAWRRWRSWRPAAGSVVAGVVAWQLAKVIKAAVARGRPFELVERFARRIGTPMEGLGFVSGHSAVAFSMAAVCSPYLSRRGRFGAYTLAAVVGLARIQVSAHLPMDVVGGAALGYSLGQVWNISVGIPVTGQAATVDRTRSGTVDPRRG